MALGVKVIAYDPGILISYKNGNGSIEMPVWLAQWIVNHAGSPRRGALADALGVPLDAVNADRIAQIKASWNAQADEHNQWDSLSIDEMLEYALHEMRSCGSCWNPIETVPRDGTFVDLWIVGQPDEVDFYAMLPTKMSKSRMHHGRACEYQWASKHGHEPEWYGAGGLGHPMLLEPTHWMPLPSGPVNRRKK